jgi:Schlafen, AlbA_2
MNSELFEQLLYEDESTTLDFKKKQYLFARATEEEKSELLKDILGFANAWRRSEACILIGVKDVKGGRSNVIGIPATDHLDDHSLQQFVNNLTNQPVRFHYEAFGFEGKQVGIIRIDEQTRPIYLKKDYGKLAREKVYVRRGSSTDPTKPASLEEIAQMRLGSVQSVAELLVEFANIKQDEALGPSISWDVELCKMPEKETIPIILSCPSQPYSFDPDPVQRVSNRNFFRELATFEFIRRLFRPIRIVVWNVGQVAANHVRVTAPRSTLVGVLYASEIPDRPKRNTSHRSTVMKGIRSASRRNPGQVHINKNDERFRVEIDCGDLQPGRRVWSDIVYIGKGISGDLTLCGQIFANNLPQPKDCTLTVSVSVTKTAMTVDELCSLP